MSCLGTVEQRRAAWMAAVNLAATLGEFLKSNSFVEGSKSRSVYSQYGSQVDRSFIVSQ
jgi:hypothetical protein